ncbi:hypothetical protein ACGF12_29975 [Kitasatospora sp. NPDC048296]|uniref:hypothetical protein n=1 Tax=Kitasatospora sp. NPDC048296 TaxID=3364048 RepID=UPI003712D753
MRPGAEHERGADADEGRRAGRAHPAGQRVVAGAAAERTEQTGEQAVRDQQGARPGGGEQHAPGKRADRRAMGEQQCEGHARERQDSGEVDALPLQPDQGGGRTVAPELVRHLEAVGHPGPAAGCPVGLQRDVGQGKAAGQGDQALMVSGHGVHSSSSVIPLFRSPALEGVLRR